MCIFVFFSSTIVIWKYSNNDLDKYFDTPPIKDFIHVNFLNYIAHIVRRPNSHPTKQALFILPERSHAPSIFTKVKFLLKNIDENQIIREMSNRVAFRKLLKRFFPYLKKKNSANLTGPSACRRTQIRSERSTTQR